jgi:hypothetical protein
LTIFFTIIFTSISSSSSNYSVHIVQFAHKIFLEFTKYCSGQSKLLTSPSFKFSTDLLIDMLGALIIRANTITNDNIMT